MTTADPSPTPSAREFGAVGVASGYKRIGGLGLADLLAPGGGLVRTGPAVGPVELGWRPRYPSWRRGFVEGLG